MAPVCADAARSLRLQTSASTSLGLRGMRSARLTISLWTALSLLRRMRFKFRDSMPQSNLGKMKASTSCSLVARGAPLAVACAHMPAHERHPDCNLWVTVPMLFSV